MCEAWAAIPSIDNVGVPPAVPESATGSTCSAASMNDVDTDQRRHTIFTSRTPPTNRASELWSVPSAGPGRFDLPAGAVRLGRGRGRCRYRHGHRPGNEAEDQVRCRVGRPGRRLRHRGGLRREVGQRTRGQADVGDRGQASVNEGARAGAVCPMAPGGAEARRRQCGPRRGRVSVLNAARGQPLRAARASADRPQLLCFAATPQHQCAQSLGAALASWWCPRHRMRLPSEHIQAISSRHLSGPARSSTLPAGMGSRLLERPAARTDRNRSNHRRRSGPTRECRC